MEEVENIKIVLLQTRHNSLVIVRSLDSQFQLLKERFLKDKLELIDKKANELVSELSSEWLSNMDDLENEFHTTVDVADNYHALYMQNCEKELNFELQAALDEFEDRKRALKQEQVNEITSQITNLEEQKIKTEEMEKDKQSNKRHFLGFKYPKKRIKPTTVTGPFIVYHLNQTEIYDDLMAIKAGIQEVNKEYSGKGILAV